MRDQNGHALQVRVVPYSSVVGQSLTIHDRTGRVVGMLSLLQMDAQVADVKTFAGDLAGELNRSDVTLWIVER